MKIIHADRIIESVGDGYRFFYDTSKKKIRSYEEITEYAESVRVSHFDREIGRFFGTRSDMIVDFFDLVFSEKDRAIVRSRPLIAPWIQKHLITLVNIGLIPSADITIHDPDMRVMMVKKAIEDQHMSPKTIGKILIWEWHDLASLDVDDV